MAKDNESPRCIAVAEVLILQNGDQARSLYLGPVLQGFSGTDLLFAGDVLYLGSRQGADEWWKRRVSGATAPGPTEKNGGAEVTIDTIISKREVTLVQKSYTCTGDRVEVWKIFSPWFPSKK